MKTVRSYLDILAGTFMIRQLQPWHQNISKRQVKAPKVYLRDSGILHALLNLPDFQTLHGYTRVGASWEGFAIEQTLRTVRTPQAFFWATHSGAEVDLFFIFHGRRYGIECKFSEAPKITKSMHQALESVNLTHLWIIHPGVHSYPLAKKVSAWPLKDIASLPTQVSANVPHIILFPNSSRRQKDALSGRCPRPSRNQTRYCRGGHAQGVMARVGQGKARNPPQLHSAKGGQRGIYPECTEFFILSNPANRGIGHRFGLRA